MTEACVRVRDTLHGGRAQRLPLTCEQPRIVNDRWSWQDSSHVDEASILGLRSALKQERAQSSQARKKVQAMSLAADNARVDEIRRLAVVAHELRSPLAPMRNAVAILGCGRPQDTQRVRLILERQIAHMSRMIEDLIDVSRTSTGKLTIAMERVSLPEIVEQAREACAPELARRGQRLLIDGLSLAQDVMADPGRLLQMLGNLLGNASKYSPDGKDIRLELSSQEGHVAMKVSDEGIGISADALAHVFVPFMQESRASNFNRSGLGVGLGVVRELVEAHGGTVTARSAGVGRGASFTITLARCSQAAGDEAASRFAGAS